MSAIFGAGCRIHPITDMPIENGRGALSDDEQALAHCDVIEQMRGKAAADEMREKVRAFIAGEHEHPEQETIDGH